MLLSCSLLIRINDSHDTALLLNLMQPVLLSYLTFSHVSLPPQRRKDALVEISRQLSIKTGQHFVVSQTFKRCLKCFFKVSWCQYERFTRLKFFLHFFWNQQKFRTLKCFELSVCSKLCSYTARLSGFSIINEVALQSCVIWRTN